MPQLPKLWLLVNRCSQCHSPCRLAVYPSSLESFYLVPVVFKYILFPNCPCKKYCNLQFTAVQLNSNDYFKSIFQTDLNCECLRCFLNGLFIDLDASEIIFLKKQERQFLGQHPTQQAVLAPLLCVFPSMFPPEMTVI